HLPVPTAAHMQQARKFAQAVLQRDPSVLAASSSPAPRPSEAAPSEPVQISMWGPAASGKTVLVAQLYLDLEGNRKASNWEIFPTASSERFGEIMRNQLRSGNLFPTATAT